MTNTIETKFAHQSGSVRVVKLDTDQLRNNIKPAVYTVMFNDMAGEFYLETTQDRFKVPSTVYGNSPKRAERVLRTYAERTKNTGILLTGNKGSGKTMLSEIICNKLLDQGIPVVMVAKPFSGPAFTDFITSLGECVIMIDEFTKVYSTYEDRTAQEGLLTLMDGIGATKKMFILTENYTTNINEFLLSRPGRLYYHFKYGKLDEETIQQYCEAKEVPADVIKDVIETSRCCCEFSFDILTTIVEEYLRYGDKISDLLVDLNIQIQNAGDSFVLEVQKVIDKETKKEMLVLAKDKVINKPQSPRHHSGITFYDPSDLAGNYPTKEEEDEEDHSTYFHGRDVKYESLDKVVYETDEYIIVAKPVVKPNFDYFAF